MGEGSGRESVSERRKHSALIKEMISDSGLLFILLCESIASFYAFCLGQGSSCERETWPTKTLGEEKNRKHWGFSECSKVSHCLFLVGCQEFT